MLANITICNITKEMYVICKFHREMVEQEFSQWTKRVTHRLGNLPNVPKNRVEKLVMKMEKVQQKGLLSGKWKIYVQLFPEVYDGCDQDALEQSEKKIKEIWGKELKKVFQKELNDYLSQ